MNNISDIRTDGAILNDAHHHHCHKHGICWATIIGGAVTAIAVSLILLLLGSAIGLSNVSPESSSPTIAGFTAKMAIWLIIMQWLSAGLGGYLAGRLRAKWIGLHNDEVLFRDTAHGFLTWAVATVATAALFASGATSVISGGLHAATAVTAGAAMGAAHEAHGAPGDANAYYVDSLFRGTISNAAMNGTAKDVNAETAHIIAKDMKDGNVSDADKAYLAQLVQQRTGLNQADAAKRVDDTIAQLNAAKEKAKQAAEAARETAMQIAMYTFFSLLIGAFIASAAAAFGGSQRDEY